MTKEIAINVLNQIKELILNDKSWLESTHEPISQCFDMAIKALEQQLCEDCISRKSAIDAMIKLEQDDIECYGCAIPEGFNSTPAIEALNSLPSVTPKEKTGWIPVSERLPEECSGVLVYCPENKNIFLAYLEICKWYIFSPRCDEPIDEPIVAWMPLPEPYKSQESEG